MSQNGQLIGWAVFGGLVAIGFLFGVVAEYESPKPVNLAKAPKENLPSGPAPAQKVTPESPSPQPKPEPAPKNDPPKVDPPKVDPPKGNPPPKTETVLPKKTDPKMEVLSPVSFRKDVMPILRAHCLNCHGAGTGKPKGDVNLTSIANMAKSRGKILVPGKPNESDFYTAITEREMPDGGRPKPTDKELMTLRNWILSGAKDRRRTIRRRRARR